MPAAVETNGTVASFYTLREPAWHGLGYVAQEEHTPHEMLKIAKLADWDVRAMDLTDLLPPSLDTKMNKKVIIRNNPYHDATDELSVPFNALGVVGGNYEIAQNEELADFLDLLGARGETAGSINNGTTVFMTAALERDIVIDEDGANDTIKNYFMLATSHDGSSKLTGGVTPVRVVCANTLQVARRGMTPTIQIRHSKSLQDRLADAKKAMDLQVKYTEQFAQVATDLYQVSVNDAEFQKIVELAFPAPDKDAKKAQLTRWDNKVMDLRTLWNGPTQENIAKTGWAAFNALTEDQQWNRKVYKGANESKLAAGSSLDALANKERNRLLSIVSEFVGV